MYFKVSPNFLLSKANDNYALFMRIRNTIDNHIIEKEKKDKIHNEF